MSQERCRSGIHDKSSLGANTTLPLRARVDNEVDRMGHEAATLAWRTSGPPCLTWAWRLPQPYCVSDRSIAPFPPAPTYFPSILIVAFRDPQRVHFSSRRR
jgi:hypothetical protein